MQGRLHFVGEFFRCCSHDCYRSENLRITWWLDFNPARLCPEFGNLGGELNLFPQQLPHVVWDVKIKHMDLR